MGNYKMRFSDFNVRTKLYVLIGIFLISLILLGSVVNLLFKSSQTTTIVVNAERVFVEGFDSGIEHFYKYNQSGNAEELRLGIEHLDKAILIAATFANIDSILKAMPREEWVVYLFDIYKEGVDNDISKVKLMGDLISMLSNINPLLLHETQYVARDAAEFGKQIKTQIAGYATEPSPAKLTELQTDFEKIHVLTNSFASKIYSLSEYITSRLFFLILFIVLILGAIVTFISIKISNSISYPINKLAENFKEVAKGNLSSSVSINTKNEVGDLSNAFLEIQLGLQNVIRYSKKVAQGDYSSKLIPKSNKDELTLALNKMAERLEHTNIHTTRENWLQKGINGLDDQMRGNFSVRELSKRILIYLSNFLQVETGAVYVFDEVLEHLEFTASLGINPDLVEKIIQPGEGLIGRAALQDKLQIVNTKNKYHRIFSATGEIYPEQVYLLAMKSDKRIQAVIELAPVNELSELKKEFLELIAERISVNLGASVARFRNNELLDKTLEQAEVLKARDEELSRKLEENRLIQEQLSRETALLNSMLKTLPDYVYFKDVSSKFIRISESMVDLFDAGSSNEIIGKSDFDFHPQKDAQRYFNEEMEIIEKGKGFVDEVRQGIDENGQVLWTSVTKLPMYDESGNCIGTFGISKDVTHIKKLEIEVIERNEKLNAQQEELKAINDQLKLQQEELKATNEELKSQEEELKVANEELAEQTKILTENEKNLHIQQEELQVTNEELETKTSLLEMQKREISEKNENLLKTQNELKLKARELEQASQYKSEFLANMSHELRTPLNSLLILSKLLGNNKKGNLTDEQVKSINIIHKSGNDLLNLINEILDLSKIEAGKMTYDFAEVMSEEIVTEINHGFIPVAENKGLALELKLSKNFPKIIYTDRQRLLQIIKNLLSNAFKFTNSGSIKVNFNLPDDSVRFLNPELNSQNTYFISVEDSGVGIPKSKTEAIFEAFQQADGSISRRFGGTGLGLSISKQLAFVLGGEIHVESKEGIGSVFTLYLPLEKELTGKVINPVNENKTEAVAAPAAETVVEPFAKQEIAAESIPFFIEDDRDAKVQRLLVLIIHNEKEKAEKLMDLCHKRKFNVIAASNIREGIILAERFSPQAIIISAELNESKELQHLKENKSTQRLPLHLVSRIEDSVLENIEELKTPQSEDLLAVSKNIENKFSKEFKQVLVVEDDLITRKTIQMLFENKDIIIHEAKTGQQAYDILSTKSFDCVILDLGLPDFSGNELLKKLNENNIAVPNVIIHTARELNAKELRELHKYSDSIVIKGVKSDERLMDEVTLFLHQVEITLPKTRTTGPDGFNGTGFKGKKVLVVDDDIRNVFALVQILEDREIEVLEAENGEIAIEVLKNNPDTDLVLMDIMMPVMNGYDAMSIIRKTPVIEEIPIITLTAKAMKEDYQKAIDCGANDYISKPVDVNKLLSLLKIWLFK